MTDPTAYLADGDELMLGVDPPTASRPTITLRAAACVSARWWSCPRP